MLTEQCDTETAVSDEQLYALTGITWFKEGQVWTLQWPLPTFLDCGVIQ